LLRAPEYVRTSNARNSSVTRFCCSGVAVRQFLPIASAVIRVKSKFGKSFTSSTSRIRASLPAWIAGSDLIVLTTSVATRLTTASGASCASASAGSHTAAARNTVMAARTRASRSNRNIGYSSFSGGGLPS
jgi:hypothetical protein